MRWVVAWLLLAVPTVGSADDGDASKTPPRRPAEDRPNIILLIGDDHGYPYFGFTGNEVIRTPNLDALSKAGTTFTRAHTTASTCPPSLNTLLTGLYPVQWKSRVRQLTRTGHPGLKRHAAIEYVATLPRVLAERGYVSFQAGKFWEGPATLAGFTSGTVAELKDAYRGGDHHFGRESIDPALQFIDENADRPFFLWFAPMLPHVPFNAPDRFRALYADEKLSNAARSYYANCTWFDELVGQLLRHLDERKLRQNTLVVYISDNGYDQPATGRGQGTKGKDSMHEQGFRTPLVFNWPGHVPAGKVLDRFVSSTDLFPTLCDFAGIEQLPVGREGTDLRPLLAGGNAPERRELIGRAHRKTKKSPTHSYYVTNEDWHYIWNALTGEEQLFAKANDENEETNVLAEHPTVARDLRARIEQWEREVTAPFRLSPTPRSAEEAAKRMTVP